MEANSGCPGSDQKGLLINKINMRGSIGGGGDINGRQS